MKTSVEFDPNFHYSWIGFRRIFSENQVISQEKGLRRNPKAFSGRHQKFKRSSCQKQVKTDDLQKKRSSPKFERFYGRNQKFKLLYLYGRNQKFKRDRGGAKLKSGGQRWKPALNLTQIFIIPELDLGEFSVKIRWSPKKRSSPKFERFYGRNQKFKL